MVGFGELITQRPIVIIVLILAITGFMASSIESIETTGDPLVYLPDNEEAAAYREISEKYGNIEYGLIILDSKNGDILTKGAFVDTLRLEWALENSSRVAPYFADPGKPGNVLSLVDILAGAIGYLSDAKNITRADIYYNMTQPWSPWVRLMNEWYSVLSNMGYMDGWHNVTYFNDDCIKASLHLILNVAPRLKEEQKIDLNIPPDVISYIVRFLSKDFNRNALTYGELKASGMLITVAMNRSIGNKPLMAADSAIEEIAEGFQSNSFQADFFAPKIITRDINESADRSLAILLPIAVVVILLILLYSFRSIGDTILAFSALIMALMWMYGIANLLDLTLSTICIAAPILLIGLGIDYSIHVIDHYKEELENGYIVKDAIERTVSSIGVAILLSTVTTVAGFLSNLFSDLNAIADFGVLCAAGIASSFIISNTYIPAMKYLVDGFLEKKNRLKVKRKKTKKGKKDHEKFSLFSAGASMAEKSPSGVVVVAIIISLISAYTATNLSFDFDNSEFLPEDTPIKATINHITNDYDASSDYISLVIKGDMTDPDMLLSINNTVANMADDKYILKPNNVPQATSIVTYLKSYYTATDSEGFRAIYEASDTLENDKIPDYNVEIIYQWIYEDKDARKMLKNYLNCDNARDNVIVHFLSTYASRSDANLTYMSLWDSLDGTIPANWMKNETVNQMIAVLAYNESAMALFRDFVEGVSGPYDTSVLNVFVKRMKTSEIAELRAELDEDISTSSRVDVLPLKEIAKSITITGGPILNDTIMRSIQSNQAISIALMVLVALVILTIVFRFTAHSAILGAITTVPVVLVVSWILATLYLLGYTINVMTTMISALTIGLGIDYSIHVSHGFVEHLAVLRDRIKAIKITTKTIGTSLLGASTTTIGGFLIITLSPLPPLRQFGLLTAITIFYSIIAALYVLPSMLVMWAKNKEDLYSVDDYGLKYMEYQCTRCKRPFVVRMAEKKDRMHCPYCGGKSTYRDTVNIKQIENMVSSKLYVANYMCGSCGEMFQVKTVTVKETMSCPKCGKTAHVMKDQFGRPMARLYNARQFYPTLNYAYPQYYPQQYYYTNQTAYYNQYMQYYGNYYQMYGRRR